MARGAGEAGRHARRRRRALTGPQPDLPPLTYLSFDGVATGVGASQVLPYVLRLAARGVDVTLHSFEHGAPAASLSDRLAAAGVRWRPHAFRGAGTAGGAARVARAAPWLRGRPLVHARSDLAAASALLARPAAWVWDVRSFWVDQRIALGAVRPGSPAERALRRIERGAARRADAIVTLTEAAVDELGRRHGSATADRAAVVTTCVDLDRFPAAAFPAGGPLCLLLSGSFNALYDLAATLDFVRAVRRRHPADLRLVRPHEGPWDAAVRGEDGSIGSAPFEEMPAEVRRSHAGICICRRDQPSAIVAAMPTKIGEFLASGRPVVVNRGLGDMDRLASEYGCAVVIDDDSASSSEAAAERLLALVDDPASAERCRRAAEAHFSLDDGVDRLLGVYAAIAAR